jgi:hypothetical protein
MTKDKVSKLHRTMSKLQSHVVNDRSHNILGLFVRFQSVSSDAYNNVFLPVDCPVEMNMTGRYFEVIGLSCWISRIFTDRSHLYTVRITRGAAWWLGPCVPHVQMRELLPWH